ncbi:DUF3817 domain-containing protein [Bradyrhizobium liaoningense]|uniref:DUF3817 domain-containing protein n=1 Tax=Bradyrhizobium liaoningense TaxID=43992 RepID=UPI001BA7D44A|nr:DUF3817 domain-containing protein [Bradyrhizobium liaoningense]MBR0905947.1 DUF3817 domain-containing protein [Bradyrhizobium liaoningense]
MNNDTKSNVSLLDQLQLASVIEASTLAVLVCVAVPLKHLWDWPIGVRVIGPLHGLAFIFYCWTLLQTAGAGIWQQRQITWLAASAFVPFAGFVASRRIRQHIEALREESSTR